jgi:DNA-binding GntR family transcriptional regulator
VARLRQAIISGELAPKTRLTEPDLARQLNVSRTPLREAIRQLEVEGFITTIPRVGSFVSELEPQDVEDLYAIRAVIEGLAARLAAESPAPDKRALLGGMLKELEGRMDNFRHYHEISGQFHDIIVQLSGNRRLQAIYQAVAQHISRMRIVSNAVRGRLEVSFLGHQRIAAAILRGQGAEAERAMRTHIEGALGVLRRRLRTDQEKAAARARSGGRPARRSNG